MTKTKKTSGKKSHPGAYPFEFRIRAVRLYLEEGFSGPDIAEELGFSDATLYKWVEVYNQLGEEGLKPKPRKHASSKMDAVKKKAVDLKTENPAWGVRRISDILKRWFLLQTSPETVRKVLNEEALIEKPKRKKPKRNITTPRRFERSTPNQMWQTDICTFRLAGKNAYLLGFIDDYSRYIVGLGLYRSQTAENLLEVYRTSVGEYGTPKEMLTDNGRQYTNWRGTTRFEKELQKDRIKHIKSQPHHPMTLGKIERFWKSILNEFLLRAQFDSFETARERISLWVKYYNYKRPHQGIGSLCPADRFFEIQNELRHTLEKGIEENILEEALRGKPTSPFYMVGRLGDQNVVIRAEKGKVKMHVDGDEHDQPKEFVYNMDKEHSDGQENSETTTPNIHSNREGQSSSLTLDGAPERNGDMQGIVNQQQSAEQLAGSGDGSDAVGSGAEERHSGGDACTELTPGEAAGQEIAKPGTAESIETGATAGEDPKDGELTLQGRLDGQEESQEAESQGGCSTPSKHDNSAGPKRPNHRHRRRRTAWRFSQYLL